MSSQGIAGAAGPGFRASQSGVRGNLTSRDWPRIDPVGVFSFAGIVMVAAAVLVLLEDAGLESVPAAIVAGLAGLAAVWIAYLMSGRARILAGFGVAAAAAFSIHIIAGAAGSGGWMLPFAVYVLVALDQRELRLRRP